MNKIKEAYKEVIVRFIIENYLELKQKINTYKGAMDENELNQRFAALKITAESDDEIEERIKELHKNDKH